MTIVGMVVAALLVAVFSADYFANVPFGADNKVMNMGAVVAGLILGYISFSTFREQK